MLPAAPSPSGGARASSLSSIFSLAPVPSAASAAPGAAHRQPAALAAPLPPPVVAGANAPATNPLAALQAQGNKLRAAAAAGVDLARKTFMSRLLGASLSAMFLGVAVALTVATGGAAAPVLAIAALRFISVAADAACAYKCWRDACDAQAGRPVSRPLPMRASAVGNLVYAVAIHRGYTPEEATRWATRGQGLVALSLAVAGAVLGGIGPAATVAEKACRMAAGALLTVQFPVDTDLIAQGAQLRKALTELQPLIQAHVRAAEAAAQAAGQAVDLDAVRQQVLAAVGGVGMFQAEVDALADAIGQPAPLAPAPTVLSNPRVAQGSRTGVVVTTVQGWVMSLVGLAKALG